MRVWHSPPTPFAVQINFTRECSLHSLLSMYRKDRFGTACSVLTTKFPVIVKESQACLHFGSVEQWCHRCFFRCNIPVGHTGRSHRIKTASSAWLGMSVCSTQGWSSTSTCGRDEARQCGRELKTLPVAIGNVLKTWDFTFCTHCRSARAEWEGQGTVSSRTAW